MILYEKGTLQSMLGHFCHVSDSLPADTALTLAQKKEVNMEIHGVVLRIKGG